jgi:hypothetical protein
MEVQSILDKAQAKAEQNREQIQRSNRTKWDVIEQYALSLFDDDLKPYVYVPRSDQTGPGDKVGCSLILKDENGNAMFPATEIRFWIVSSTVFGQPYVVEGGTEWLRVRRKVSRYGSGLGFSDSYLAIAQAQEWEKDA